MIRQLETDDCGQAVVRYLLASMSKCRAYEAFPVRRRCDSLIGIKDELADRGIATDGFEISWSDLAQLPPLTIVRTVRLERGHFMVLTGKSRRFYRFFDPARGDVKIKRRKGEDLDVTSALTYVSGRPEKIPAVRPLRRSESWLLSGLPLAESAVASIAVGALHSRRGLQLAVSLAVLAVFVLVHFGQALAVGHRLDEEFVLPYLRLHPKGRDYPWLLKVKSRILTERSLLFGTVGAFGLLAYMLLSFGLPYFVGASFCGVTGTLLAVLARRLRLRAAGGAAVAEDEFLRSLKKRRLEAEHYRRSCRLAALALWSTVGRWVLMALCALLSAAVLATYLGTVTVESVLSTALAYLVFGTVFSGLFEKLGTTDFSLQELSKLERSAYELLCPKRG